MALFVLKGSMIVVLIRTGGELGRADSDRRITGGNAAGCPGGAPGGSVQSLPGGRHRRRSGTPASQPNACLSHHLHDGRISSPFDVELGD